MKFKRIIVTGGAGFIGGALIRKLLTETESYIYNFDKVSYASDFSGINKLESSKKRHIHHKVDLKNKNALDSLLKDIKPDLIIHLAAETHVDRSIEEPSNFIESNILGTFNLLQVSYDYWKSLKSDSKKTFRFHHVSTDEVFGSISEYEEPFNENSLHNPSSPYSASKSSGEQLVKAWYKTYKLPIIIMNCTNNYGPYQYSNKLIQLANPTQLSGISDTLLYIRNRFSA